MLHALYSEPACLCDPKDDLSISMSGKIRLIMLQRCDQFLDIITSQKLKDYRLETPLRTRLFTNDFPALITFSACYGYFSPVNPIISHVSKKQDDLSILLCMLTNLAESGGDGDFVAFAIAELIAKALSYRDLKLGQQIMLPVKKGSSFFLERFTVDHVFNLWKGMPAFGLVPDKKGISALLLFRGTDLDIYSKRGWASLMSDVDMAGPGLSVFKQAQSEIHQWLFDVAEENKKAVVLGFSLGGCFAVYTFLYENDLLNATGSAAFNAPGVSESVFEEWNSLPTNQRLRFASYINRGDIVSKKGHLIGPAYELSTDVVMKPLFAHTVLMSGESSFIRSEIDVRIENARRFERSNF